MDEEVYTNRSSKSKKENKDYIQEINSQGPVKSSKSNEKSKIGQIQN